jgi:hypothetical protein
VVLGATGLTVGAAGASLAAPGLLTGAAAGPEAGAVALEAVAVALEAAAGAGGCLGFGGAYAHAEEVRHTERRATFIVFIGTTLLKFRN